MITLFQEKISKSLGMKKKEDLRTIFLISLAWFIAYVNWTYIIEIQHKCI
jgi:hypothetical protein